MPPVRLGLRCRFLGEERTSLVSGCQDRFQPRAIVWDLTASLPIGALPGEMAACIAVEWAVNMVHGYEDENRAPAEKDHTVCRFEVA